MHLLTSKKVEGSLSICVCGKDDQRYSIVFNIKKIFICLLISGFHLTFTIIFYYHAVMNTFIQWQETINDAYLTDTSPYFPFIEPNVSLRSPRKPRKHTKERFDNIYFRHILENFILSKSIYLFSSYPYLNKSL